MAEVPEKRRRGRALSKEEKAVLVKQIATRAALGDSLNSMAEAFNIDKNTAKRILEMPETKDVVNEICDEAVQKAKNELRMRVPELASKAYAAINALLDSEQGRDKAEGVKLVFRTVGLDKLDEGTNNSTLIIQMPGGEKQEKVLEVESYPVDDDKSGAM